MPRFVNLSDGWYPDMDACDELEVAASNNDLFIRFEGFEVGTRQRHLYHIRFENCAGYSVHTWRAESFEHGEGADRWTEEEACKLYYRLVELQEESQFEKMRLQLRAVAADNSRARHFMMMLRDYTFECRASSATLVPAPQNDNIEFKEPEVEFAYHLGRGE